VETIVPEVNNFRVLTCMVRLPELWKKLQRKLLNPILWFLQYKLLAF